MNLSLSGVPTAAGIPIAPYLPQTLTATISNNQSVMLLSKYTVGPLRLFAGYEWYQLAPPSDPVNTVTGFTNIGGLPMGSAYGNLTAISNVAFSAGCGTGTGCSDKVMQVMWTGARYAVSKDLDVASGLLSLHSEPVCQRGRHLHQPHGALAMRRHVRRRFRPGRLAVSAEVGRVFRYDVLAGECRPIERLSRPQQLRSDGRRSLPLLSMRSDRSANRFLIDAFGPAIASRSSGDVP